MTRWELALAAGAALTAAALQGLAWAAPRVAALQQAPLPDLQPLINLGGIGTMLGWMMFTVLPRLDRIERAINRQSRSYLLEVLSRGASPDAQRRLRGEAKGLLREMGSPAVTDGDDDGDG